MRGGWKESQQSQQWRGWWWKKSHWKPWSWTEEWQTFKPSTTVLCKWWEIRKSAVTPSTVSSFRLLDFFEKRSLGTWKRSRNHQFSHKKDRRGFKSLKKFDLFSSSPSLLDKSSECSDQDSIRKSSLQLEGREVLQFTSMFYLNIHNLFDPWHFLIIESPPPPHV